MSAKLWFVFAIVCSLSLETFGLPISQRVKRRSSDEDEDNDEDKDEKSSIPDGIKFGSQQESQSSSENVGKDKSKAIQQSHQGQQQMAAEIGGKHYVLQQQISLAQQMAKLGKKTAVQQLADAQKQAVIDGKVEKSGKTNSGEKITEDKDDDDEE